MGAWNRVKHEKGFTLLEVLVSLVIISIIFAGVFNLFIFTNKAADSNNNRLVAINIGKATIERVKTDPFSFFPHPSESGLVEGTEYDKDNCNVDDCEDLYMLHVNDHDYEIAITVNQNEEEKKLNLIDVLITVELPDENIRHQLEGYVSYESEE